MLSLSLGTKRNFQKVVMMAIDYRGEVIGILEDLDGKVGVFGCNKTLCYIVR